jgi:hypothetical protein
MSDTEQSPGTVTQKLKGEIVAEEVAVAEFDRFVEAMGLDLDDAAMDQDDKASLENEKGRILRAIRRGFMVVNDAGELVFTPQREKTPDKTPIRFREPTGATLMAIDRHKEGKNVHKLYAILADVAGCEQKRFALMAHADAAVCRAVASLFLGG